MKRYIDKLILVTVALLVAACADLFEPTTRVTNLEPGTIISNTAGLAHTFVHDDRANVITCTTPPPDAAFDQSEEGDVVVALVAVGGDQGGSAESESGWRPKLRSWSRRTVPSGRMKVNGC